MEKIDLDNFPTYETSKRMLSRVSPVYERSYVGKWIFQVMGMEMEAAIQLFRELPEQAFPETVTWGIDYWERWYGITPPEGADLETRRRNILTKRATRQPMNPAKMEWIVESMTGYKAKVTENVAPYTFSVEILTDSASGGIDYDALISKLKQAKPSHQNIALYLITDVSVEIGAVGRGYKFPHRMAGTYPQPSTIGDIEDITIEAHAAAAGSVFRYPTTGEHRAGTIPQENITLSLNSANIEAHAKGTGVVFPFSVAGIAEAGTIPNTNTIGRSSGGSSLSASIETTCAPFDFPLCGEGEE